MNKLLLLIAALALTGCATTTASNSGGTGTTGGSTQPRPDKTPSKTAPNPGGTPEQPQVNSKAKLLFEDANKAYEAQRKNGPKTDFAMLQQKYANAAAADERLGEATYNLGVLAQRQGKLKEAVGYYKEALQRKPSLKQAALNLAVIAQNSGDEAAAVAVYTDIQTRYPDDASSRARLAEIYRRKGECEKAVGLAKEALFREPHTLVAYKVLMLCAFEAKQFSMARLVALRATKIDDNDPEIFFTLGQINLLEKEPAKARVQFKKAVEARADFLPAHLQLAKMALETEDYTSAEESIRRILQANGNNPEALMDLGVAYKGMGQYDKASAAYDAAEKIKSDMPELALNRGFILAVKGQPEKAIESYKKYLAMKGTVDDKHPVHEAIKAQEAILQRREDDKKAAEEAAKMEAEAKKAEEAAAAEEKKTKEEEFKKTQDAAKSNAVKDAAKGVDTGEPKPEGKDKDKPGAKPDAKGAKPDAKGAKPEAKPAEEPKKEEPKKGGKKAEPAAAPTPAPAKAAPKGGEEPSDSL